MEQNIDKYQCKICLHVLEPILFPEDKDPEICGDCYIKNYENDIQQSFDMLFDMDLDEEQLDEIMSMHITPLFA